MNLSRPVFILAPPRSGSTLLFETLAQSEGLWSLGDEGHGIIERHPALSPAPFTGQCNRLTGEDLTASLAEQIRQDFASRVRNRTGQTPRAGQKEIRLLEKTPKNILRIPFFLALFPDARFIYLYRDPRENISSIIDGWRSGRFRTYLDKQTDHGPWSFLLPPGWEDYRHSSLGEIATFQWRACHQHALQDLAALPAERWCALNFDEFLKDTEAVVQRLCRFMETPVDEQLLRHCQAQLPLSRYTLSAPAAGKWRRNAAELAGCMGEAAEVAGLVNAFTAGQSLPLETDIAIDSPEVSPGRRIGRNEPCPCGSGKKYKRCHGRI